MKDSEKTHISSLISLSTEDMATVKQDLTCVCIILDIKEV